SEAQVFLDRADAQMDYTRLIQATIDVYSGRPQQAIQTAKQLHPIMRGIRLLELRTLAVLAAAQSQSGEQHGGIRTPRQDVKTTKQLHPIMRGFRLLELRRLAVLAAAQFQSGDQPGVIQTLHQAVRTPQGISPFEARFFSPETRRLAATHIKTWPQNTDESSIF